MRQIGTYQHTATVFLSSENCAILDKELQQNYNISIDDVSSAGATNKHCQVHILPPPVVLQIKKECKLFSISERDSKEPLSLHILSAHTDQYDVTIESRTLDDLSHRVGSVTDIRANKEQQEYTELSIVAEIAYYMNESPLKIENILNNSEDGLGTIIKRVNEYNELLYDLVIPGIFHYLYKIEE